MRGSLYRGWLHKLYNVERVLKGILEFPPPSSDWLWGGQVDRENGRISEDLAEYFRLSHEGDPHKLLQPITDNHLDVTVSHAHFVRDRYRAPIHNKLINYSSILLPFTIILLIFSYILLYSLYILLYSLIITVVGGCRRVPLLSRSLVAAARACAGHGRRRPS